MFSTGAERTLPLDTRPTLARTAGKGSDRAANPVTVAHGRLGMAFEEREPAHVRSQLQAPVVGRLCCCIDSQCEDQSPSDARTASAGISDTAPGLFR